MLECPSSARHLRTIVDACGRCLCQISPGFLPFYSPAFVSSARTCIISALMIWQFSRAKLDELGRERQAPWRG